MSITLLAVAVFLAVIYFTEAADVKRRPPVHPKEDEVIVTALHTASFGLLAGLMTAAVMYYWPRWADSETRRLQRLREKKKGLGGGGHKSDCPCCH